MDNGLDGALDAIKEMLSSPEGTEKISSILSAITGEEEKEDSSSPSMPDAESMMKIMQAYKSIKSSDDDRVKLLKAIKPYVRNEKKESVDTAIKMLTLIRLTPLLGEFKDIF